MRVYTTTSISPYEILAELLTTSRPFNQPPHAQFRANSIIHSHQAVCLFHPLRKGKDLTLWDIMESQPDVARFGDVESLEDTISPPRGTPNYPLVMYHVSRPPSEMVERFAISPMPERSYSELVNTFLSEPIPLVEVTVGSLEGDIEPNSISFEEFQPDTPSVLFAPMDARRFGDFGTFLPMISVRLEYRSRLELLWKLPESNRSPAVLFDPRSIRWAFLMRFLHPNDPCAVMINGSNLPSDVANWEVRARQLFADTLAMLSALLGYTTLETNELALLILSWWALAAGNYVYHLKKPAVTKTSVLLLSDMLSRVEDLELFVSLLNRASPSMNHVKRKSRRLVSASGSYEFDIPVFQCLSSLTHSQALRMWNLLRTQIGLAPVNMDNYLEVPHAFEKTIKPCVGTQAVCFG